MEELLPFNFLLPFSRFLAFAGVFAALTAFPLPALVAFVVGIFIPLSFWAIPGPEILLTFFSLGTELILGALFGLLASVPILAARLGGALFDRQMAGSLKTFAGLLAGVVLLGTGMEKDLLYALSESFTLAPAGEASTLLVLLKDTPVQTLIWTLEFSIRVGWPALSAVIISDFLHAFLARTHPQVKIEFLPRQGVGIVGMLLGLSAIAYTIQAAARQILATLLIRNPF